MASCQKGQKPPIRPLQMKLPFFTIFLLAGSVLAGTAEDRLLEAKLHIVELRMSGLGPNHPKMLAAQAHLYSLSPPPPGTAPGHYLNQTIKRLEEQDAAFNQQGLGEKHPVRTSIAAEIKSLRQELQNTENLIKRFQ